MKLLNLQTTAARYWIELSRSFRMFPRIILARFWATSAPFSQIFRRVWKISGVSLLALKTIQLTSRYEVSTHNGRSSTKSITRHSWVDSFMGSVRMLDFWETMFSGEGFVGVALVAWSVSADFFSDRVVSEGKSVASGVGVVWTGDDILWIAIDWSETDGVGSGLSAGTSL